MGAGRIMTTTIWIRDDETKIHRVTLDEGNYDEALLSALNYLAQKNIPLETFEEEKDVMGVEKSIDITEGISHTEET
jgi:hypothetical protein